MVTADGYCRTTNASITKELSKTIVVLVICYLHVSRLLVPVQNKFAFKYY